MFRLFAIVTCSSVWLLGDCVGTHSAVCLFIGATTLRNEICYIVASLAVLLFVYPIVSVSGAEARVGPVAAANVLRSGVILLCVDRA